MRRRFVLLTTLVLVATGVAGCGDRFSAGSAAFPSVTPPPGNDGIGVDSQLDIPHPLFGGLRDLVAGDGSVRLAWDAASDDETDPEDIVYQVFLASGPGDENFSAPTLVTAPGVTSAMFSGLPNGATRYAVVRAVDLDGNIDPNKIEWFATPNRVRYVRAGAPGPGADGLTPGSAFPALGQAVGAAIPLGGVNFWVAEGLYPENVFLFPGMCVFGGFAPEFDLATRDPESRVSQFATLFGTTPLATLAPSAGVPGPSGALVAIDGISLAGNDIVPIGVFVEDAFFRLSRCQVFDMLGKGIELRSKASNNQVVEGFIRDCVIEDTAGEGLFISGITDVVIDNNVIRRTGTEGIESQWISASTSFDARIDVTRNRIEDCGDEGIDLDFGYDPLGPPIPSQGARIRVFIRNNLIRRCGIQGIQVDLDFKNSDGIDFRGRIEDNEIRANLFEGILLDGDARGSFRVARNAIVGNRLAGIHLTGTANGPYARLLHNRILGNGSGIIGVGAVTIEVRHQILRANRGPAVFADRAVIDVVNSILMENSGASTLSDLRHSLVFSEENPNVIGPGVVFGDPGLESHPEFLTTATAANIEGEIPLGGTPSWQIGDGVEVRDDGILREVTAVGATSIFGAPPVDVRAGDLVSAWGDAESAIEREGLFIGSPAIDGGDPLEIDRDGTRSDLGPIGGDTPGNIGIETAIPLESAALELIGIEPSPAELQTGTTWTLTFNRDLVDEIADLVRVGMGVVDLTPAAVLSVGQRTVELDLSALTLLPGDIVRLEILPGELPLTPPLGVTDLLELDANTILSTDPGSVAIPPGEMLMQPAHILFSAQIGIAIFDADLGGPDVNGSIATAQLISGLPTEFNGAIDAAGDVDIVRFDLSAGQELRTELFAAQIESPLAASITLIAQDGTTVLLAAEATAPFFFDPVLPLYTAALAQTVYVRVETSDGIIGPIGPYRLLLR